jgi:hypothetical protein
MHIVFPTFTFPLLSARSQYTFINYIHIVSTPMILLIFVAIDKAQGHGLHQNKGLCEVELSASAYSGKTHGKGLYCT